MRLTYRWPGYIYIGRGADKTDKWSGAFGAVYYSRRTAHVLCNVGGIEPHIVQYSAVSAILEGTRTAAAADGNNRKESSFIISFFLSFLFFFAGAPLIYYERATGRFVVASAQQQNRKWRAHQHSYNKQYNPI